MTSVSGILATVARSSSPDTTLAANSLMYSVLRNETPHARKVWTSVFATDFGVISPSRPSIRARIEAAALPEICCETMFWAIAEKRSGLTVQRMCPIWSMTAPNRLSRDLRYSISFLPYLKVISDKILVLCHRTKKALAVSVLHMIWFCHYPNLCFPREFLVAIAISGNIFKRGHEYAFGCTVPHDFS